MHAPALRRPEKQRLSLHHARHASQCATAMVLGELVQSQSAAGLRRARQRAQCSNAATKNPAEAGFSLHALGYDDQNL
ncbi:hypothetical protein FHT08_002738 [Xanthomonas campestris]|nr:hypothetical protein [Xanthomonas sp. CFBP 8151]